MRDRSEQILRIACLTLAALVVLQLVHAGFQVNPLAGVKIPAVPVLETNANSAAGPASKLKQAATNSAATAASKITTSISTNLLAAKTDAGTNLVSTNVMVQTATSNSPLAGAKIPAAPTLETNGNSTGSLSSGLKTEPTNLPDAADANVKTSVSTNSATAQKDGTNLVSTNVMAQTATNNNPVAGTNPVAGGVAKISRNNLPPSMAMAGGMNFGGVPMMPGMPGMPGNAPKLPPEIQARVDKIVNSEIFAPVMHPMPMGLLGIAGETAFVRTASGQTGLLKAGDSLGDLKLLKIGINRVLVEQNGQKQELTIFDGYGGDSLLSNQDKITK